MPIVTLTFPEDWTFVVNGAERVIEVSGNLAVNENDAPLTCGLEGQGYRLSTAETLARYAP